MDPEVKCLCPHFPATGLSGDTICAAPTPMPCQKPARMPYPRRNPYHPGSPPTKPVPEHHPRTHHGSPAWLGVAGSALRCCASGNPLGHDRSPAVRSPVRGGEAPSRARLLALGNRSNKRDQGAGEENGAGRLGVCRMGVDLGVPAPRPSKLSHSAKGLSGSVG